MRTHCMTPAIHGRTLYNNHKCTWNMNVEHDGHVELRIEPRQSVRLKWYGSPVKRCKRFRMCICHANDLLGAGGVCKIDLTTKLNIFKMWQRNDEKEGENCNDAWCYKCRPRTVTSLRREKSMRIYDWKQFCRKHILIDELWVDLTLTNCSDRLSSVIGPLSNRLIHWFIRC